MPTPIDFQDEIDPGVLGWAAAIAIILGAWVGIPLAIYYWG